MRMYILIRDSVPLGLAMAAAGHGPLACYLQYKDDPNMQKWLATSFRKVICKVNDTEFETAKTFTGSRLMTESALDGAETALVFIPRPDEEWPKPFKFYKLWR